MKTFYSDFTADGVKGSAAFVTSTNTTIVYLYRRSATTLASVDKPNGNVIYTFVTGNTDVSLVTNGWSVTIPSGTDTLYVVAATAYSNVSNPAETVAILTAQWGIPRALSQNNIKGTTSKTIYLFKRSTSSTPPAGPNGNVTYTVATDTTDLSLVTNGWALQANTDTAQGVYTFITYATIFATSTSDSISTVEWATPIVLSIDGTDGINGDPAISGSLTNDSVGLPALANGTVTSFADAVGQFKVFSGGSDVTAVTSPTLVFGTPTLSGCTGTINTEANTPVSGFPKGYYRVTAMTADIASMTMTATYAGVTITKIFSLSKSIKAYEVLATFPTTNNFEGRLVYLTADVTATGTFPLASGPSPGGTYGIYPARQQYKYTTDNGWVGITAANQVLGTLGSAQIAALDASKLTGTLSADLIAANTIVASKFLAVDTNNLITDPNFTDAGSSATSNYWFISTFTVNTNPNSTFVSGLGSPSALVSPTGNGTTSQSASEAYPAATRVTVEPLKPYRFFARTRVSAGFTGRIGIVARWYKYDPALSTPTLISSTVTATGIVRATNPSTGTEIGDFRTTASTIAQNLDIEGVLTAPSDAQFVRIGLQVAWSTTLNNAGSCAFAFPRAMRAMNAEMVVDGSITANKLTVTELSAISAQIGVLNSSTNVNPNTGERVVISDGIIKVYDNSSTSTTTGIRVKLGNLAL